MKKRFNYITAIVILILFALSIRIAYIDFFKVSSTSASNGAVEEIYGSNRGLIFDRNMKKIVETDNKVLTSQVSTNYKFKVPQRYADNQILEHIIGYTDSEGRGISGIEKDYNDFFNGINNNIKIKYYKDAQGRILKGKGINKDESEVCNNSGVCLSIDFDIQSFCEGFESKMKKGAIIVSDSNSGEILSLVSFPSFNPNRLSDYINRKDYPFLNRAISNYNVGSVYKVVICMVALESGISEDYTYNCKGHINCSNVRFNCHNLKGHGKLNMKNALAKSCNTYFISLAQKIGAESIIKMSKKLGLDKSVFLSNSIVSDKGNLPETQSLYSPAALANLSFGQGELLETPLNISTVYSTIANKGFYVEPSILKCKLLDGKVKQEYEKSKKVRVISSLTANKINSFLEYTVNNGTGINAKLENGVSAGKTATAQTGKFIKGKEILISYFVGYITTKDDNKYTILVMKENGSSGSGDCAPIFKEIGEYINSRVN